MHQGGCGKNHSLKITDRPFTQPFGIILDEYEEDFTHINRKSSIGDLDNTSQ